MPQGCDFICDNPDFQYHGQSIRLHSLWPVQPIDNLISKSDVEEEKLALAKRKNEGRNTALLVLPRDKDEIPTGWRIQLFCLKDLVRFDQEFPTPEEAKNVFENPPVCEKCGEQLYSYKMLAKLGMKCPSCQKTMTPNYWFSK